MAVEPSGSSPAELEADDLRDQHRHRLAEHRRLRLDAAHAPAEHPEPVDHRGVRVGAHERVGEGLAVARLHHAREVLEVHLVADAGVGRDDLEVVERGLAPAQEGVALAVALELELGVALEGQPLGEHVHLDRVVDHELDRHQRVDPPGVAAELLHRVAHRGEVDDRRHAGEVLHQHPRRRIGDLGRRLGLGSQPATASAPSSSPLRSRFSNRIFSEYGSRAIVVLVLERVEAKDLVGLPARLQGGAGAEAVCDGSRLRSSRRGPRSRTPPGRRVCGERGTSRR